MPVILYFLCSNFSKKPDLNIKHYYLR